MSVLVALLETGRPSRPVTGHTIGMCVLALRLVACLSMQGLQTHHAPGQYLPLLGRAGCYAGLQAPCRLGGAGEALHQCQP